MEQGKLRNPQDSQPAGRSSCLVSPKEETSQNKIHLTALV